jgi:hypothetical protein
VYKDTPQTRTLYRALEICGGETALAAALKVPVEILSIWLAGADVTPEKIYFEALDLVAMGWPADRGQSSG